MNIIDQIVHNIIRPTRDHYHINRLGQRSFTLPLDNQASVSVRRYDQQIMNKNKQNIELSYFANSTASSDSCVIYLHANNGSRVQGLQYLHGLLYANMNVCLFDFTGSGISGGQFISLGLNQSQDLECVIKYLNSQMKVSKIILWGRSMGACTALMYANKYPSTVQGLILDSPFKDLRKLIKQLGAERTCFPKCFFQPLLHFVNQQLKNKIGFELDDYKLKKHLNNLDKVPVLFLVSKRDKLVKPHHGEKLYSRYPSNNKHLQYLQIQHHENRTNDIIYRCVHFIKYLLLPKKPMKTPLNRKGNLTSRTMNSKESQEKEKVRYYQNNSLMTQNKLKTGSTRTSLQDLHANLKIQMMKNKVSLKQPFFVHQHQNHYMGKNNMITNNMIQSLPSTRGARIVLENNRAKISLANFVKPQKVKY